MFGPELLGHWSSAKAQNGGSSHGHLHAGKKYSVIKLFADHDQVQHPVGEFWLFMGSSFLPYDDGLSLFVSLDGAHEWPIRMQWREEVQGAILDSFEEYMQQI